MTKRGSKNSSHSMRPWSPETGTWCELRPDDTCTGRQGSIVVRLDVHELREAVTRRVLRAGRKRAEMDMEYAAPGTCVSPRGLKRCSAAALYGRARWVRCYTPGGEPGFMMGVQLAIRGLS